MASYAVIIFHDETRSSVKNAYGPVNSDVASLLYKGAVANTDTNSALIVSLKGTD